MTINVPTLRQHKLQKYGWLPDYPDHRDTDYKITAPVETPPRVDLRPHDSPLYDQLNLGCHDVVSEVLTEQGWRSWVDYDGKLSLGTVNPSTHALEFQYPTALHAYDYKGPMIHGDHRSLDFLVTPNHRMYLRKWDQRAKTLSDNFDIVEADKIGWYAGLLDTTASFVGLQINEVEIGRHPMAANDFIALLALVISDGWVGATEHNKNRISFCCFDERYEHVVALASQFGFSEVPNRRGVWLRTDAELANWLRNNIYDGSGFDATKKRIPQLLRILPTHQVKHFLDNFGDQHVSAEKGRQFYSSSKGLIDDLQELLLRTGKRSGVYEGCPKDVVMRDGREIKAVNCAAPYTLTERTTNDRLSINKKRHVNQIEYNGPVFCATVPNSLLVTRRNNQILISGNSCTANALASAVQFDRRKQGFKTDFVPSRLFIYYQERLIEGNVNQDSGAMLRDGIKSIAKLGVPPETDWPYNINHFAQKPPTQAYTNALKHTGLSYQRLNNTQINQLKSCLASGYPFVFGFTCYESLETVHVAQTGFLPMPGASEGQIGGHAVMCVGYDDNMVGADGHTKGQFIVRNSWGTAWGQKGYFMMPYAYLTNAKLADDFWQLTVVSG